MSYLFQVKFSVLTTVLSFGFAVGEAPSTAE